MKKENLIKQRLFANSILRQLKKTHTYDSLSRLFTHCEENKESRKSNEIPIPVLARYVKGHVLPSDERTKCIIKTYDELLKEEVRKNVSVNEQGHFNHLPLLYNTILLQHVAAFVVSEFSYMDIDKILSTSTDGLPIAYAVGFELGVEVVYAKKKKEIGVQRFIEQQVYVGAYNYSLYIPEGSLRKGEHVLIVDDAIRSQITSLNLIELCKKAKAIPVGVFALISVNDGARKLEKQVSFQVKSLIAL
ncbi:MAG: phosphoribosyltransferase family protein [Candidatus Hodarchaeota archaeon]